MKRRPSSKPWIRRRKVVYRDVVRRMLGGAKRRVHPGAYARRMFALPVFIGTRCSYATQTDPGVKQIKTDRATTTTAHECWMRVGTVSPIYGCEFAFGRMSSRDLSAWKLAH